MRFLFLFDLFLLICPLILVSCNGVGELKISREPSATEGSSTSNGSSIVFNGITSIDLKTDSTLRLNWIPHADAIAYDVYNVTTSPMSWMMTVNGQASSSASLTGLTPGQLYKFLVRVKDASGNNDTNTNEMSAMLNSSPDVPASLSLISPASPGYSQTPLLQVGGVKAGDTVKIYSNNICTTEVASGVATGASIDLATSVLALGTYNFYAKAINATNASSACSTATTAYQVIAPSVPSALSLVTPGASPSFSRTPVIRVSGVSSGHTVKIYTNNTCVTEVASGTSSGPTIDLTTSALSPGTYTLYARAINGTSSACSTANVSYTVISAFAGISSISLKTDSTLRINWASHASATSYEIYNTTSGTTYLSTVNAPGTSYNLSGLTPGATYTFLVRAKDSQGILDWNTNSSTVTMNPAPDVPSALALITPSVSPGVSATPTIRVSGVKNGDTVKLFSDNTCATEVSTGVSTGSSIDLITSTLSVGSYTFYARAINNVPTASACSTASVAYVKNSCPTGFIPVPANPTLGTTVEFCVMKFEAKNVGAIATSQAALAPWSFIDSINAQSACTSIGPKYDIISNPEWMTIAYEIEKTASNWSGGVLGTGSFPKGHTDNSPSSALAVSNVNDPYDGTGNVSGNQKRTFTLSNSEVIWDFSGNVGEWIDWSIGGGMDPGPTSCLASSAELKDVFCPALAAMDYLPGNPAGIPPANYIDATYSIGHFYGGTSGYAVRGGGYDTGPTSGIFDLDLSVLSNNQTFDIGFRCVYRP